MVNSVENGDFEKQLRDVQEEYLEELRPELSDELKRIARFSTAVNVALLSFRHRQSVCWGSLLTEALRLRPAGLRKFFSYSRVWQRTSARLRARV